MFRFKNYSEEEALEAVKRSGYALQFVKNQTEEIRLEAVKRYGYALQFVKNQTEEICLEAVKRDGCALQFVKNQTEEICLEAVKRYGCALRYVKNQTEEICLAAVKRDGYALQFVKNQTEEICLEAIKQSEDAIVYVEILSEKILEIATDYKEEYAKCFQEKYPKPCPFCGSGRNRNARKDIKLRKELISDNEDLVYEGSYKLYQVYCTVCHASAARHRTEGEAIEAWNKRYKEREIIGNIHDNPELLEVET